MNRVRNRLIVSTVAVIAVGTLLTACGGAASTTSGGTRADTVIIGTGAIPQTLDPILGSEVQTDFTVGAFYDKLVGYNSDGELIPQLASEWEYNDDATQVTLTLRDDAVFHSGTDVTAADVVYTLDRIKKLGIGSASFLTSYVSSEAIDPTHVLITLDKTDTTFVGALSKAYVVDSALVAANEGSDDGQSWLAQNDAGSGPYELTSYTANQSASFDRYAESWRFDEARPEHLTYRYITESATLRDELTSGGVDLVTGMTPTDQKSFTGNADFQGIELQSFLQLYVMMNTQKGITADPKVREAIQLAYDYDGHIASILGGGGTVATGIVAPGLSGRVETAPGKQDLAKAKKLIDEAGVAGSTLTLAYQSVIPEHGKAGTLLQSNLKEIGIDLQLRTVTFPEYSGMVSSPETVPDLALLWDFPYYPEIGPMLYRVYDSQFIGQTNYALYSNPEVDALLESGMVKTDRDSANADFEAAQKLIIADRVSANISDRKSVV